MSRRWRIVDFGVLCAAVLAIIAGVWSLRSATAGLMIETVTVDGIPATVFRPISGSAGPAMVIAHGFAGSQQLMRSFATTLARNGYVAVTFDFAGHARNPGPLTGSISERRGTRTLVAETALIARFARPLGDGRLAVLGHSMASDIVVRFAETTPGVGATIAVSMFSPAVTATEPWNLLIIVGDWEGMLKREALRAVGLASARAAAVPGVTYGDPASGTARRAAFSPHVEHVGVLYSSISLREAVDWLDHAFGIERPGGAVVVAQGPWIILLLAGVVALAWPLSRLLPRIATPAVGAGLGWRRIWVPLLLPGLVTPLALRVLPTHFLPVLVGDYLAAHFATYGLITAACLIWLRVPRPSRTTARVIVTAAAVVAFGFVGLVWPIDAFVTSFVPGRERLLLILAMLLGTSPYFLADEWLTRGQGAARGAYAASKLIFLISLAIAIALDFERLFFLIIILPVIVPFFLVYGLISAWTYRSTGHPFVAAIADAIAFAWAIGVTFPLLAG